MCLETLAQALALRILQLHGPKDATGRKRGGLTGTRLRTVLERMHMDFTRPSTTTELANLAGLSVDHFVRTFRSAIGEPPHRYLLRERIHEAQRLLSTTSRPLVEMHSKRVSPIRAIFTLRFAAGLAPHRPAIAPKPENPSKNHNPCRKNTRDSGPFFLGSSQEEENDHGLSNSNESWCHGSTICNQQEDKYASLGTSWIWKRELGVDGQADSRTGSNG